MRIDRKHIVFIVISVVLLLFSSVSYRFMGPIVCTIWIIFIIINHGMKGGLIFTLLMSIISIIGMYIDSSADKTLAIVGMITYFIMSLGMGIPIDLMKREQAKRFSSEERLRRITDNMQDVIIQINQCGIINYISTSCLKCFGYPPEYYIGKNFYEFVHPDDNVIIKKAVEDTFMNKGFNVAIYRYIHKEGSFVWLESLGEVIGGDKRNKAQIVMNCRDITERRKTEEKIKYLSFHDSLTGLYNRVYFEDELKKLVYAKVLPLSIIIGDVNGLKLTNDVFGHYEGDRLLVKIADILTQACRKEDIVARWGGDEFAILLPNTDEAAVSKIVKYIHEKCSECSGPIKISIAIGTSTQEKYIEDIKNVIKEAEEKMYSHKLLESRSVRGHIIDSLENTLFETSNETREHADRMMEMGRRLGRELGLSEDKQNELDLLALLHDIGKIAINDSVLEKPSMLNEDEWEEMKKHPEVGFRIAESTKELYHISDYILTHHERWDGKGYPQGLKGEQIPKLSRVLAIIDAYDVMTHVRPYKKALSSSEAMEEIRKCAGSQFDPDIARVFINMLENE